MQIKITVDIENTDILKFFELFKKDLATVAKNTTVETSETVETVIAKNATTEIAAEQPQKKRKKPSKNDCADFTGVNQTEAVEEKADNSDSADNNTDNSSDNSLENDFNFNAEPIEKKVFIVKEMLVAMAKGGRKAEAKEILTKNKVAALSKLCEAEEKILVKIYNEVKNAQ